MDSISDLTLAKQIVEELWKETQEPALRFRLEKGETGLFDSKVGGIPYLPRGAAWPQDDNGSAMALLAQLDCSHLTSLPDFPHTGFLQFFIALDDLFGANFDDISDSKGFQILYHETVDRSVTAAEVEKSRPPYPADSDSPVFLPCRIQFGPAILQGLTANDYRFEGAFLRRWNARRPDAPLNTIWDFYKNLDDETCETLFQQPGLESPYHQCGGYPYFTQSDPREHGNSGLDVLLFQLDSDMPDGEDLVLWGDVGVGNFFISRDALKKRDFSCVGYNWDCC